MAVVTEKCGVCSRCPCTDNQLITVRVRQVSADLGYINIDICPDIGKVSVYGRWSLIREVVEDRFYCTEILQNISTGFSGLPFTAIFG